VGHGTQKIGNDIARDTDLQQKVVRTNIYKWDMERKNGGSFCREPVLSKERLWITSHPSITVSLIKAGTYARKYAATQVVTLHPLAVLVAELH